MPNTWDEARTNDQTPPKPDGYKGNGDAGWVMTGQDGRLGYEPGTGDIDNLEELRAMRNPRPVR